MNAAPGPPPDRTVLFIGSYGRSGSTLLDRLLGQAEGFVSIGESYWLWQRGVAENQLCGCGVPLRDCPFWREVFEQAFGGFGRIDLAGIAALQKVSEGHRYSCQPALPWAARATAEYREILARVYRAVLATAGARVVVDSSKFPARGFVLRGVSGLRLASAHLVRDSRAVAFSWQRRRVRPEIPGELVLMPRRGAVRTAAAWTAANLWLEAFRVATSGGPPVRYEALVTEPRAVLQGIAARLGEEPSFAYLDGAQARLGTDHTVAGNPMRFATGSVALALDTEWTTALRRRDRALVTALTWPLLVRYGYLSRKRV